MPNFNKVLLIGHAVKEPEMRYTPSGIPVANTSIGVNHKYKSGEEWKTEVSFFNLVFWAKTAEYMAENLKKGMALLVEGRLKQESWEKDGKKQSRVVVVVDSATIINYKAKESKHILDEEVENE